MLNLSHSSYYYKSTLDLEKQKEDEVYLWDYKTFEDVKNRIPYFIEECTKRKGYIQLWDIVHQMSMKQR